MDEKKMDTVPQLSLDTQEVPTLTLDLEAAVDQPFTPKPEPPQDAVFDESSLTEAERKMVNDFAEKISQQFQRFSNTVPARRKKSPIFRKQRSTTSVLRI